MAPEWEEAAQVSLFLLSVALISTEELRVESEARSELLVSPLITSQISLNTQVSPEASAPSAGEALAPVMTMEVSEAGLNFDMHLFLYVLFIRTSISPYSSLYMNHYLNLFEIIYNSLRIVPISLLI